MDFYKPPPLPLAWHTRRQGPRVTPSKTLLEPAGSRGYFQLSLAGHEAATQPLLLTNLDREAPLLPTAQKLPHPMPGLRTKKDPSLRAQSCWDGEVPADPGDLPPRLCDLGLLTEPLCASACSLVKTEITIVLHRLLWGLNKVKCVKPHSVAAVCPKGD